MMLVTERILDGMEKYISLILINQHLNSTSSEKEINWPQYVVGGNCEVEDMIF